MNTVRTKMSMRIQWFVLAGILAASMVTLGCGERELSKKQTFPADGRILFNGEPVRFATIQLEPVDPKTGMPADGSTDAEGKFTLRTYSNEEPDGAVPGEYILSVSPGEAKPGGYDPEKGPKYTDVPPESRSTKVVIEEKDNDLEVVLP